MPLQRIKRTNLDAAPNQMVLVEDATRPIDLVGYHIYNPNGVDVFVKMFNATSGVVTVGTTAEDYGVLMIPSGGQVVSRVPRSAPLFQFTTAITVIATTTPGVTATTSPTSDLEIELFYYD